MRVSKINGSTFRNELLPITFMVMKMMSACGGLAFFLVDLWLMVLCWETNLELAIVVGFQLLRMANLGIIIGNSKQKHRFLTAIVRTAFLRVRMILY